MNILRQVSYTGVIGLGMTFVIISGGIDLSVGSMVAFIGGFTVLVLNYFGGGDLATLLPADAVAAGDGYRFVLPDGGIETLLTRLIAAGHGISGLSIERPGLHEAFVRVVGEADAAADAARTEDGR